MTSAADLVTARLRLRAPEPADVAAYHRLWTSADVRRHLGGPVAADRLPAYERSLATTPHLFSVVTADDGVMIGSVVIDPGSRFEARRELSYQFLPEHWGRGYAREAVRALLAWAFTAVPSPDPSIIAVTQVANTRSRGLLESLGMRRVETFEEFGEPQAMYALTAPDLRG
ncbi:GNAT family N-acetyltransferase [Actinorhabdospora filicis]|nr:GNAT family N-acetyltransferase [Actinorhabdospora filicis]